MISFVKHAMGYFMGERRLAAVAIAIARRAPHGIIFVQRSESMRSHAGQIGLPGGGIDPIDNGDLEAAARREMHEEVGVPQENIAIVAKLPEIHPRMNRYVVTPFVAVYAHSPLQIDGTETVGVFTVPLATVLSDLRDGMTDYAGFSIATPILDFGDYHIWGLTGMILRSFVDRWNTGELRALVEPLLENA